MVDSVLERIWQTLVEKNVSLVMLYNREGEILWHRGRRVDGQWVQNGRGFSTTCVRKSLETGNGLDTRDIHLSLAHGDLPGSALFLRIRSLQIQALSQGLFLYADSGSRDAFSDADREVFRALGEVLSGLIRRLGLSASGREGVTGRSAVARRLREMALAFALESEPVLLLGETGVGKSHLAEVIHHASGRPGRLVVLNTPAIPENLFESELFGHRRGAFTDAREDREGAVTLAEGGTLFLDEIAETPPALQAKLLRFIETRRYQVLGDSREREGDVRIVAATNRDLETDIRNRTFREDLYYRLSVLELTIPPLRQRREDIADLVREREDLLRGKAYGAGFWEALAAHEWPGNFRELHSVLKRLGIMGGDPLTERDVLAQIRQQPGGGPEGGGLPGEGQGGTERVWPELSAGNGFWECIWPLFIERHRSRKDMHAFLKVRWHAQGESLKALAQSLFIPEEEYKKFVAVLHKYDIHPRMEAPE